MPILLPEDMARPLPHMHRVAQHFHEGRLEDIPGAVAQQFRRPEIQDSLWPGASVAVAVGSRGIRNLALIVRAVLAEICQAGCRPFIVSAMGSHGGGTEEGQRQVLSAYGITEEALGVKVLTCVETVQLGRTAGGVPVHFDRAALEADVIVPINRIKLHTDFVADIQSGLCKMLAVGLGNHRGCSTLHEEPFDRFGGTILDAVEVILERAPVGFGVGIVENCHDETALIEAVPACALVETERALLQVAKANMPRLMIPEIDVLIVEEIGKNISGAGYDPNILGKSYILNEFVLEVPEIQKMVLLSVTPQSHGNAIGMGIFDVITRAVFDCLDLESIYANAIAVKCAEDAKIPLIAADEHEAVRVAVKLLRGVDPGELKIVRIKNTLELGEIQVSPALLNVVEADGRLSRLD